MTNRLVNMLYLVAAMYNTVTAYRYINSDNIWFGILVLILSGYFAFKSTGDS